MNAIGLAWGVSAAAAVAAVLTVVSAASSRAELPPWRALLFPDGSMFCPWHGNFSDARRSAYATCVKPLEKYAKSAGDLLQIELLDGTSVVLVGDADACEVHKTDQCLVHKAAGYFEALDWLFVLRGYYEGQDIIVIDRRSGSRFVIENAPHVSADYRHFAVLVDNQHSAKADTIEIWHRAGSDAPRLLASIRGQTFMEFVGWKSDTSFAVRMHQGIPNWCERIIGLSDAAWRVLSESGSCERAP